MKRGETVTVTATIDAFKDGLISGRQVRVNVNGTLVWVPIKMTDVEEQEKREGIMSYMEEEMNKRLIWNVKRSIDEGTSDMVQSEGKEEDNNEE